MEDKTGKPDNLMVKQEMGFVYVEFADQSLCEEAFAIQRYDSRSNTLVAVGPIYFYYADKACGNVLRPGREYADDLSGSKLIVGHSYEYRVAAIAPMYMARLPSSDDLHPPFRKSSDVACKSFEVQWVRIFEAQDYFI